MEMYDEDEALRMAIALSKGSSTEPCQVCFKDLTTLSLEQRQGHYEQHFSDTPTGASNHLYSASNSTPLNQLPRLRHPRPQLISPSKHRRVDERGT
jgi:hypothetical protein